MAISADFITLQKQIADELGDRQDLLAPLGDSSLFESPIKNAIYSAIAKWEREPFYFIEAYTVPLFTAVVGQEFYTVTDAPTIATAVEFVNLHLLQGNTNRFTLIKRPWQYLEEISISTTHRGMVTDWAYFTKEIRLYPIPDVAYPIRASLDQRFSALVKDGDSNVWTQDAFDLIRSEAKLIIAQEVLFDDDLAARMKLAIYGDPTDPRIKGYLGAIRGEGFRRGRSKIRPSFF